MNTTEEATNRLSKNLRKIVRVALINYNKQSAFYRQCNTPERHVKRLVQHFYLGFFMEVKAERAMATAKALSPFKNTQRRPSLSLQF